MGLVLARLPLHSLGRGLRAGCKGWRVTVQGRLVGVPQRACATFEWVSKQGCAGIPKGVVGGRMLAGGKARAMRGREISREHV